jgi:2-C-methyl-D-erythritol 4-phosphate cytidylyltransferase
MKLPAPKSGPGFDEALSPAANKNFAAVICAAGCSSRMGGEKKEYCLLPGSDETVLGSAVSAFAAFTCVKTIVIAVPNAGAGEAAARNALPPVLLSQTRPEIVFAAGGKTRRASVHNALSLLFEYQPDYVLIHDGARPWVSPALIEQIIKAVQQYRAAIPLLPLAETPKEIDAPLVMEAGDSAAPVFIKRQLCRSHIGTAQTPQGFAFPEILSAHQQAAQKEHAGEYEYTDDAEVWGEFCGPVAVVPGSLENRKITFPEDLTG